MENNRLITAVNFHLWEPCNMRCKFCFATFQDVKNSILPKGHLPEQEAIEVVQELAKFGFEKITFAGGEPTLCPWLSKLIRTAKDYGLTTMIVTNGTRLTDQFLEENQPYLDWIALSVDSLKEKINKAAGRAVVGKRVIEVNQYKEIVDKIKSYNYGLKINTVVHAKNVHEDLSDFITYAKPIRWKVFQVLPIKGQNDLKVDEFTITQEVFDQFNKRHQQIENSGTKLVIENNDHMQGSYAMVDPAGRFFDNNSGKYIYSDSILVSGCKNAYAQTNYSSSKFILRGGSYDWKLTK
jgi:radical S-adenosyl methionine domain-containing protein 2